MTRPKIFVVPWLPWGAWGATLPPLGILLLRGREDNRSLKAHELWHWHQYREWGFWRFYWRVATQYAKYKRFKAPMELEAPAVV